MAQVEVHPKVLVLPSAPSGRILAKPAQATCKHFLTEILFPADIFSLKHFFLQTFSPLKFSH